MKKFLCGTMIFLSASLASAESDVITNTDTECVEPIGLAIDQPGKISPNNHANTRVVAGDNQVAPIDCATTPYVGVCEPLDGTAY